MKLLKGTLKLLLKILPWVIFGIVSYLWYHGQLNGIIKYLSNPDYSIKIGKTKVTPFLVIKSAIIIIYLFWFATIIADTFSKHFAKIKNITSNSRVLVIKSFNILVYTIAFFTALQVVGIDLTALAVFSGAIGIGVGFGLQKITSNFISGFIMLFEKSISEGDLIQLENGIEGFVRGVGARATLIETYDGREVMVPNENFISNNVINYTHTDKMARIELKIGVSYNADIRLAQQLILEAAKNHKAISKIKAPECYLREFADSSVNFTLFAWVDDVTEGRFSPTNDILFYVWDKFKENNIEIPFPQRDMHIRSVSEDVKTALA